MVSPAPKISPSEVADVISVIVGAVVSARVTSAFATGFASPVDSLPAVSVTNPVAMSIASAVPPVASVPPNPAKA